MDNLMSRNIDNVMLTFRKAITSNFSRIVSLYKSSIERMISNGIYQWDEKYPDEAILAEDIKSGNMYVAMIDNAIVAVYVISENCDEAYKEGNWKNPNLPFLVIHRLCVSPDYQHKGIAKSVMIYIESQVLNQNVHVIRLDCFTKNPYAIRLYTNLDYDTVGKVTWRKGDFFLMEKSIS